MPTIHKTKAGADTEIWGYPVGALGSHKLGTLRAPQVKALVSKPAAK